jgi:hypothetical protein
LAVVVIATVVVVDNWSRSGRGDLSIVKSLVTLMRFLLVGIWSAGGLLMFELRGGDCIDWFGATGLVRSSLCPENRPRRSENWGILSGNWKRFFSKNWETAEILSGLHRLGWPRGARQRCFPAVAPPSDVESASDVTDAKKKEEDDHDNELPGSVSGAVIGDTSLQEAVQRKRKGSLIALSSTGSLAARSDDTMSASHHHAADHHIIANDGGDRKMVVVVAGDNSNSKDSNNSSEGASGPRRSPSGATTGGGNGGPPEIQQEFERMARKNLDKNLGLHELDMSPDEVLPTSSSPTGVGSSRNKNAASGPASSPPASKYHAKPSLVSPGATTGAAGSGSSADRKSGKEFEQAEAANAAIGSSEGSSERSGAEERVRGPSPLNCPLNPSDPPSH